MDNGHKVGGATLWRWEAGGTWVNVCYIFKYSIEALVFYLSISIFCYLYFHSMHHILEAYIVLFTQLHLFDDLSY